MENFSTKMGYAIWILGTLGGLLCGKMYPKVDLMGTYYTWEKTSYNLGLAITCIVSSIILGALFVSLGRIEDSLNRNR